MSYFTMPGHNFGLASAVNSFNWISQTAACLGRRYFGLNVAAYFDDFCQIDPLWAGNSGKTALRFLLNMMGTPLARGEKDVPFAFKNPFLGVVSDLTNSVCGGRFSYHVA